MNKKDVKFCFFGTGDFAVKVLETLTKNGYVPEIVITAPDRPKGRKLVLTPPAVKTFLLESREWKVESGKILQPEKLDKEFIGQLSKVNGQLFIVADYGKILPKEIVEMPKHKTLNVHPSLLPKFRGASPIQSFILSGETETGVTIMLMDEEMDHGPILAQQELKSPTSDLQLLTSKPKHKELESELAKLGGEMLVEIIPDWIDGKIKPTEQDHDKATYTKKIKKEDGLIKPGDSPEKIERKVRALTPWPGVYLFLKKNDREIRIIITDTEISEGKLVIKKIKPEGKKEMPLEDFLRGNEDLRDQVEKFIYPQKVRS